MTMTHLLLTEDAELRRQLDAESTPALRELRAAVPATRASYLITLLTDPKALTTLLDESGELSALDGERVEVIVAAALLAICDEIDRRIPARG